MTFQQFQEKEYLENSNKALVTIACKIFKNKNIHFEYDNENECWHVLSKTMGWEIAEHAIELIYIANKFPAQNEMFFPQ